MNKKLVYYILFTGYFLRGDALILATENIILGFDPVSDFRSPHSLTELLHEGLIQVESLLIDQEYNQVQMLLRSLSDSYDSMIGKSNIHVVYRDDRDFLQNLIDRIDLMIHELESSSRLLAIDQEVLYRNSDLLYVLRNKIVS